MELILAEQTLADEITTENMLVGAVVFVGLFWVGGAFSNDLVGLRLEKGPDVSRFFVSPRTNTDTGITFGYQLRF